MTKTIFCKECGCDNHFGSKHCSNCGADLCSAKIICTKDKAAYSNPIKKTTKILGISCIILGIYTGLMICIEGNFLLGIAAIFILIVLGTILLGIHEIIRLLDGEY